MLDLDGGRVLLEHLSVGGLRLVAQHEVVTRLEVTAEFGHVPFSDEVAQHRSQPTAGCGTFGCGQRSRGQWAQHDQRIHPGHEQHRGSGQHAEQTALSGRCSPA